MCIDEFHFYKTEEDGKEAVWFENYGRGKMTIKPFIFDFKVKGNDGNHWQCDIPYTIKLGELSISSSLSDWTNDLEKIRHSIEHYIYTGETKIELCFEDSPTEIRLKRFNVSQQIINGQRSFHWKYYVRVLVKPNEFVRDDYRLFGICEERQVIQRIYEAFLYVGKRGYHYDKNAGDNPWLCSPMDFYNKIKSPIIEDFLSDTETRIGKSEVRLRQVHVKHILTIMPDVLRVVFIDEESVSLDVDEDDIVEVDFADIDFKLHIPGLFKWTMEFEQAADFVKSEMDENFDTDSWNKRGLELAAKMREQLPQSIDLWYGYAFEDSVNRDKRPMLIYNK